LCLETEHGSDFGAEEVGSGHSILHPANRLAHAGMQGILLRYWYFILSESQPVHKIGPGIMRAQENQAFRLGNDIKVSNCVIASDF
jgi:hypothetical protein